MDLHLLNAEGQPVGLAGLATHLFWAEPANLVLVRLLTSGALMDVISGGDTSTGYGGSGALSASKLEALATVVAHLFVREPLQPARAAVMRRAASGTSPSVVVLPPMPPRCAEVVKQYNAQVSRHLDSIKQVAVVSHPHLGQQRQATGVQSSTGAWPNSLTACTGTLRRCWPL
jgi:hypothetical protein